MKKILFIAVVLISVTSCDSFEQKKKPGTLEDKMSMMDADREFSKMSEQKGMKNAFLDYIDSNGVLLRSGHLPLVGADAIDFLIQQNDTAYTLKWEPRNGFVAASGDLGYTYGVYALKPSMKDTLFYGTYVSIWKKGADGRWKFVLDSGNEGVGEME